MRGYNIFIHRRQCNWQATQSHLLGSLPAACMCAACRTQAAACPRGHQATPTPRCWPAATPTLLALPDRPLHLQLRPDSSGVEAPWRFSRRAVSDGNENRQRGGATENNTDSQGQDGSHARKLRASGPSTLWAGLGSGYNIQPNRLGPGQKTTHIIRDHAQSRGPSGPRPKSAPGPQCLSVHGLHFYIHSLIRRHIGDSLTTGRSVHVLSSYNFGFTRLFI